MIAGWKRSAVELILAFGGSESTYMKDEYNFAAAKRGTFYREHATLVPPVHLEPKVLAGLTAQAQMRGVSLNELVNALLRDVLERIAATR